MKLKVLTAAVFAALSSIANAAPNACESMMTCGSYLSATEEDGSALQIDIRPGAQANQITFAWINLLKGKDIGGGVVLTMTFQDDGSFVATKGSQLYATGICRSLACTYGIVPLADREGFVATQTGTFKFADAKLEETVSSPGLRGGDFFARALLTKR